MQNCAHLEIFILYLLGIEKQNLVQVICAHCCTTHVTARLTSSRITPCPTTLVYWQHNSALARIFEQTGVSPVS